eukprot:CAMPEP_0197514788 /NCGR_PEP_ID=MMETSP1318-20131121/124_1 /TAXON_ID=552666 /ORGANISM="Partenskyella glossopodia, Strain RCC365" /LENGTH=243 /DNA_ID=CAMNT_0043062983 /DNA_START=82 /DNA_END=813 /DNA_ORIENTATION=+
MGASPVSCLGVFAAQTALTYGSQLGWYGKTNKEVSDKYYSLSTPANYAFAIWGVIFTWEGVFVVTQMLKPTLSPALGWSWAAANVCQGLWSLTFAQEWMWTSSALLSGIAASMISCVIHSAGNSFVYVRAPLALHAGWVSVAALLNINLTLVKHRFSKGTQVLAAYGTLVTATAAGVSALLLKRDMMYATSISWALMAVSFAQASQTKIEVDPVTRGNIARLGRFGAGVVGAGILVVLAKGTY